MADHLTEEIQRLEERLRQNPRSLMFARLADAYLQSRRVDEAKQLCEQGVRDHPYYVTGHVMLGKCHLAKGEHDAAEKEFKRALLLDPKYLSAHKYYADLMKEIGWIKTFEMSYRKILQIDPLEPIARAMLGSVDLSQEPTLEEEEILEGYAEAEAPPVEAEERPAETEEPLQAGPEPGETVAAGVEAVPETEEEEELPKEEEEKFSGILDDIFKDEIMDEELARGETEEVDTLQQYSEKLSETEEPELPIGPAVEEEPEPAEEPAVEPEAVEMASAEAKEEEWAAESEQDLEEMIEEGGEETSEMEEVDLEKVIEPLAESGPTEPEQPPADESTATEMAPSGVEEEDERTNESAERRISMVTPTLGEIYAAQGQYAKALEVYRKLVEKDPDNPNYRKKMEQLQQKLTESEG